VPFESTGCTRCLAGSYWSDAAGACSACPEFSSSVAGSGNVANCVCDAGYYDYQDFMFGDDACLSPTIAIVSFKATVQMSIAEFDAVRADYIAGVAVALGRAEADVRIVSVAVMATGKRRSRETSVATGRRVAGDRAVVETGVTVPAGEAESVARSITADLLNSALRSRGITLAEVTVYGADGTSTTTFSPETSDLLTSTPGAVIAIVGGIGSVFILVLCGSGCVAITNQGVSNRVSDSSGANPVERGRNEQVGIDVDQDPAGESGGQNRRNEEPEGSNAQPPIPIAPIPTTPRMSDGDALSRVLTSSSSSSSSASSSSSSSSSKDDQLLGVKSLDNLRQPQLPGENHDIDSLSAGNDREIDNSVRTSGIRPAAAARGSRGEHDVGWGEIEEEWAELTQPTRPKSALPEQSPLAPEDDDYAPSAPELDIFPAEEETGVSPREEGLGVDGPPGLSGVPPPSDVPPSDSASALPHGDAPSAPPFLPDLPAGLLVDYTALLVDVRPIAAGGFKTVFRAEWLRAGDAPTTVALLKLRGVIGGSAELAREIDVFMRLGRHPHLAALLGVTNDPDGSTCMLVEFAACGSLDKVLGEAAERGETPSAAVRITIAMQMCEAMAQLVEHSVVHRDLASRNVLVFSFSLWDRKEVWVKVTDYGQALLGAQGSRGVTTHSGGEVRPVRWLAPEALQRRIYSQASDVWAYGITLWEVWSGAMVPYWEVESDAEVVQKVTKRGERLERPEGCGNAVWAAMQSCWAPLASDRPSFQHLKLVVQDAFASAFADEKTSCVVCLDRVAIMALLPCGHRCACAECAGGVRDCPICRGKVDKALRVFDT